jgi:hypothetical protein
VFSIFIQFEIFIVSVMNAFLLKPRHFRLYGSYLNFLFWLAFLRQRKYVCVVGEEPVGVQVSPRTLLAPTWLGKVRINSSLLLPTWLTLTLGSGVVLLSLSFGKSSDGVSFLSKCYGKV